MRQHECLDLEGRMPVNACGPSTSSDRCSRKLLGNSWLHVPVSYSYGTTTRNNSGLWHSVLQWVHLSHVSHILQHGDKIFTFPIMLHYKVKLEAAITLEDSEPPSQLHVAFNMKRYLSFRWSIKASAPYHYTLVNHCILSVIYYIREWNLLAVTALIICCQ